MRRPTRNLLYVVLGIVSVAFLVQGAGLRLPRILKVFTAVSGGTASSSSRGVSSGGPLFGVTASSGAIGRTPPN